jgi:hypothetical protein
VANNLQLNLSSRSPRLLLLPTLETRKTISETLCSLASSQEIFDDIIISVNGLSSENVQKIVERSELRCKRQIHLLCTRRLIPAVQHLKFIANHIRSACADDSLVFLLADDDLIPSPCDVNGYLEFCDRIHSVTVGMGNLFSFTDRQGPFADQMQHLLPGEQITSLEFLRRYRQGHLSTNMSSMVVPCHVLYECADFMSRWGSAGRRFEYIVATHHAVAALFSPSTPSALIRHHPQQAGRTLSRVSGQQDELIYIAWVWLNQPSTRPWVDLRNEYGFTLIRLIRATTFLLCLMMLRFFGFGESSEGSAS